VDAVVAGVRRGQARWRCEHVIVGGEKALQEVVLGPRVGEEVVGE